MYISIPYYFLGDIYKGVTKLLGRIFRLTEKTIHVVRCEGFSVAIAKVKRKLKRKLLRKLNADPTIVEPDGDNEETVDNAQLGVIYNETVSVQEMLHKRWSGVQPIANILVPKKRECLNVVTDSVNAESLFGGVATSIILAVLFAIQNDFDLRIITRDSISNPKYFFEFLDFFHIARPPKIEFFSDCNRNCSSRILKLEVSEQDIFLATSWWSAHVIDQLNRRNRFFYILQEVEQFFYPHGDDRLLCEKTLAKENIDFLINSKLLYDYFMNEDNSCVIRNGHYFEPAFPKHIFFADDNSFAPKKKYKLFFYGRPHNLRNLFYTGLEYLDDAITAGVINKDQWEVYIAGADIPQFAFSNGLKPIINGRMTWAEYAEFARTVDIAYCLMYTPHPSYPPLDMASSGSVVLTNKYLNKTSLDYSSNIIMADLDAKAMNEGFRKAVMLVQNEAVRKGNYEKNRIEVSWEKVFTDTIGFMAGKVKSK